MKKIGSGIQYNVYDLGNDRVRKTQTSFFEKIYRFHKIAPKYKVYYHLIHNIKTSLGTGKQTKESIENLKKHLPSIDISLLGNPVIKKNASYEQDKVIPFGEMLYSSDFSRQKELVNEYMNNLLGCWDYGFSDTPFNFMINCGVTSENKVVLTDLGELTWDKEWVERLVQSKHWEKRSSFNKLPDSDLKNYFREQFNEKITLSALEEHWNSKILNQGTKNL
ncbi:hypothetical protein H0W91_01120 [Patescibacteria group bacterium]|nr:hypothetical protein [Patescibacteria group bacterium]